MKNPAGCETHADFNLVRSSKNVKDCPVCSAWLKSPNRTKETKKRNVNKVVTVKVQEKALIEEPVVSGPNIILDLTDDVDDDHEVEVPEVSDEE